MGKGQPVIVVPGATWRPTHPIAARCPSCGEERLIEWDPVLRHWYCAVCGVTWTIALHNGN